MKHCPQCERDLPESEFGRDKNRTSGLTCWCKACKNRKARERYATDPEHRIAKATYRKKRLEDPKKYARHLELQHDWRAKHYKDPDYVASERERTSWANRTSEQKRRKRQTNRVWRAEHREHVNRSHREYVKDRYHNDPQFKKQLRDYFTRRRNTERANGGSYTAEEWNTMCLLVGGRCVACGQIAKLEVDHIVPVSMGGGNDIDNIQPLCRSCNAVKRTDVEDFRPLTLWAIMPETRAEFACLGGDNG